MQKLLVVGLLMMPMLAGCVSEFEPPEAEAEWLATFDQVTQVVPVPSSTGDYLIVERHGEIHLWTETDGGWIEGQTGSSPVVIDITDRVASNAERGLKSIAFHPAFSQNGRVYVTFDYSQGLSDEEERLGGGVLAEYVAKDIQDIAAGFEHVTDLIDIEYQNWFHNTGMAKFGPDGMLYVSFGDGSTDLFAAADTSNVKGSIVRIDVPESSSYNIPEDNPFVAHPDAAGEVWLYGLRNAWRFDFHDGRTYIADVGSNAMEEIDIYDSRANEVRNFGWPYWEGNIRFDDERVNGKQPPEAVEPPVVAYHHEGGSCAIIGGVNYAGNTMATLSGMFIVADHCKANLMVLDESADPPQLKDWFSLQSERINSIDADADGELLVSGFSGRIYRVIPA